MLARLIHGTALALTTGLFLSCATPAPAQRPSDTTAASPTAEPVPPPSNKKGVILPTDVKLGATPDPAVGNTGTAGPAVQPSLGTPTSPN